MANGLTLPFSQIIDWKEVAIRIPESWVGFPKIILEKLQNTEESILKKRMKLCDIYEKFFATKTARLNGLLLSAYAEINQNKYDNDF